MPALYDTDDLLKKQLSLLLVNSVLSCPVSSDESTLGSARAEREEDSLRWRVSEIEIHPSVAYSVDGLHGSTTGG